MPECTNCKTGTDWYLNPYTNRCTTTCPAGTYAEDDDQTCSFCDTYCKTCTNEKDFCTSCYTGTVLDANACGTTCSDGTFANYETWVCEGCHAACSTCFGAGLESCTSCKPSSGYFKHPVLEACVNPCPDGFYGEETTGNCTTCGDCQTCDAPTICLSCSGGKFLEAG